MNNNINKKTLSACIALLTCTFSGISSAAYINETLGINDSFADAQFISDTYFTNKFDADIDRATSRFNRRNISQTSLHTSILGTGDISASTDYFSFQATNGVLSLDIDNAIGSGGSFDSWIELYDSSFNLIASNDDAILDTGSNFSFRGNNFNSFSYDSFIEYQVDVDGLFYAVVGGNSNSSGVPFGSNYTLHIANGAAASIITPPPSFVPLPASVWLLLSGLVGLTSISRRRKQK
ncbi:hypothetical protein MNBD_GAMMA07-2246 [hydrothermal vent metagenome]|uniref:Peptidase C-terminal archaeal/bacterial domain-containing protein n=1 Tax=hydrothermal vent metagenome TaxID=652676 RepID=A0A3B0WV21_9ZZZZ